jgi:hypothetical protein
MSLGRTVRAAKLRLTVQACHALQITTSSPLSPLLSPPSCVVVLAFQGPFTLITDLVAPQGNATNYSLVPNPFNSSAGLPVNSTAPPSLSLTYNNITILVPCSTLQLYITAMCQTEVDHMTLINRWGILFQQFTSPMVGSRGLPPPWQPQCRLLISLGCPLKLQGRCSWGNRASELH